MKTSATLLTLGAAALPLTQAVFTGFNLAAQRPDGSCKTQADWKYNFATMKSLAGGNFTSARLYASSDCDTLANAVPAAIAEGITLLVGIWTEDDAHYAAEKAALEAAMQAYGVSWMGAVSVGSEDLYRGDTTADKLAQQIYDVRGMISQDRYGGAGIPVGHVDTYNAYNDSSAAVLAAVDFVGMDAYPYWQGVTVANAKAAFQQAIDETETYIQKYHAGTPLWITETGWVVDGPNYGQALAGVKQSRSYWQQVFCGYKDTYNLFWYVLRDYYVAPASQSFGVLDENFKTLYSLEC